MNKQSTYDRKVKFMDYFKAFENIKNSLEKSDISLKDEHLAIQVILTDEDCGGILYIENYFKKLIVMPYDYYDNNVNVISDYASFIELISGKKTLGALLEKITVKGDLEAAKDFFGSIKPAKKAAAKKTTAKKTTAKKDAEEKEVKPAAKKETAKKATAKKTETKKTTAEKAEPEKKTVKKAAKKESEIKDMTETAQKTEASKQQTSIEKVVEKESKPEKKTTKK